MHPLILQASDHAENLSGYAWGDADWMASRAARNAHDASIAVYEAHLGSWMRVPGEGGWLTYRDIADRLATTSRIWASRTWSCCRSRSTRSTSRGATARSATSHRRVVSAPRRSSWSWWIRCTGAGSASSWTGRPATSRRTPTAWPASTAPVSTSPRTRGRESTPTGLADLQLRPPRGEQLPDFERALLVREVPPRRPARGRRRLDALPRLRARGRGMGAERPRRQREPGRRRLPAAPERARPRGAPRHHDGGRGVDRMAAGDPPDGRRRGSDSASSGTWAG